MIDLAYSNKICKKIIFVTICVLMSFLLSINMFHAEAFAVVRDDFGFVGYSDSGYTSDSDFQNNQTDNQENALDYQLQDNLTNEQSDYETPTLEDDNYDYNVKADSDNNSSNQYKSNSNVDNAINNTINFNNEELNNNLENKDGLTTQVTLGQEIQDNDTQKDNDLYDRLINNNSNVTPYESNIDDTNVTSNKEDQTNSFIGNDPTWQANSEWEGDTDNPWWTSKEAQEQKAIEELEGGTGTEQDPIRVGTAKTFFDLFAQENANNKHVILIADIDLTNDVVALQHADYSYWHSAEWGLNKHAKLFPYSNFNNGVLDGAGHKIFCKNVSRAPLFHSLSNVVIKNLNVDLSVGAIDKNISIAGNDHGLEDHVAIFTEQATNSVQFEYCTFSGKVANRADDAGWNAKYIGAVIGQATGSKTKIKFINCVNNASITVMGTAKHYAGGFVGGSIWGAELEFEKCQNNGSVSTMGATSELFNNVIEYVRGYIINVIIPNYIRSVTEKYDAERMWKNYVETFNQTNKQVISKLWHKINQAQGQKFEDAVIDDMRKNYPAFADYQSDNKQSLYNAIQDKLDKAKDKRDDLLHKYYKAGGEANIYPVTNMDIYRGVISDVQDSLITRKADKEHDAEFSNRELYDGLNTLLIESYDSTKWKKIKNSDIYKEIQENLYTKYAPPELRKANEAYEKALSDMKLYKEKKHAYYEADEFEEWRSQQMFKILSNDNPDASLRDLLINVGVKNEEEISKFISEAGMEKWPKKMLSNGLLDEGVNDISENKSSLIIEHPYSYIDPAPIKKSIKNRDALYNMRLLKMQMEYALQNKTVYSGIYYKIKDGVPNFGDLSAYLHQINLVNNADYTLSQEGAGRTYNLFDVFEFSNSAEGGFLPLGNKTQSEILLRAAVGNWLSTDYVNSSGVKPFENYGNEFDLLKSLDPDVYKSGNINLYEEWIKLNTVSDHPKRDQVGLSPHERIYIPSGGALGVIGKYIEQLEKISDSVVANDGGGVFSYKDLEKHSNQFWKYLSQQCKYIYIKNNDGGDPQIGIWSGYTKDWAKNTPSIGTSVWQYFKAKMIDSLLLGIPSIHKNRKAGNYGAMALGIWNLVNWNKYTRNFMDYDFFRLIVRKTKLKEEIYKQKQIIGSLPTSEISKDIIKSMMGTLKVQAEDEGELAESALGTDLYNALINADLNDNNLNADNNAFYAVLETLCGELGTKSFPSLTGNSELLYNIFNQNKSSDIEEIRKLEDTQDFTAIVGKDIYDGKDPLCNLMDENLGEEKSVNDHFIAFKNDQKVKDIISELDKLIYENTNRSAIFAKYSELGTLYFKNCVDLNGGSIKNMAYNQDIEFSLNALRILEDANLEAYRDQRAIITNYSSLTSPDNKQQVFGSVEIRNFMNGVYTDALSFLDFSTKWSKIVFDKYMKKMLESDIWDETFNGSSQADRISFIKHFFITKMSYMGEFSFNNYCPFLRSTIMHQDPDMFNVDFEFSNEDISKNELNNYVPSGESKWKFTDKKVNEDFPIPYCVFEEVLLCSDKDSIHSLANEEYSVEDFQKHDLSIFHGEDGTSNGNSGQIITGNSIHNTMNEFFRTVQTVAASLPKSSITWNQVHFLASSGGYCGFCEGSNASVKECVNNGAIIGGDYAGGFFGKIAEKSTFNISNSYNAGTVYVCDNYDFDPRAGGFIAAVVDKAVKVNFDSCVNTGVIASKKTAGGFMGEAEGTVTLDKSCSMAAVSAHKYNGGLIGIADSTKLDKVYINNCYSANVFEANSNFTTLMNHADVALNLVGLSFPKFEINKTNDTSNYSQPGALCGQITQDRIKVNNFYYSEGTDIIGHNKKLTSDSESQCHVASLEEFSNGTVCYLLNQNIINQEISQFENFEDNEKFAFGQVLDDFSKGKKEIYPVAGSNVKVYKNELANGIPFTNYDPRYIKTNEVSLHYDENVTIGPDVFSIRVKHGGNLELSVKANEGYIIDNVTAETAANEEGAGIAEVNVNKSLGDLSEAKYSIGPIYSNTFINVTTKVKPDDIPQGSGLNWDPYLIYNKDQLHWLNKMLRETFNNNVYIKLMEDINYDGYVWYPVFSAREGMGFSGVFDGNGHKIYNLVTDNNGTESGAFFNGVEGNASKGEAFYVNEKNTETLEQLIIKPDTKIGVPEGYYNLRSYLLNRFRQYDIDKKIVDVSAEGNMTAEERCLLLLQHDLTLCYIPYLGEKEHVSVLEKTSGEGIVKDLSLQGSFADAVFAKSARNATFENCIAAGNVKGGSLACGGIVAVSTKNIKINNCQNNANIDYIAPDIYHPAVGGIIGRITSSKYIDADNAKDEEFSKKRDDCFIDAEITNCKNFGSVSGGHSDINDWVYVGGIVGSVSETDHEYDTSEEIEYDEDSDEAYNLDFAYILIDSCVNEGNIGDNSDTRAANCAGIIGEIGYLNSHQAYKADINSCVNNGSIGCNSSGFECIVHSVAGIVNFANNNSTDKHCQTNGYIVDYSKVGNIITKDIEKKKNWKNTITNCVNNGGLRTRDDSYMSDDVKKNDSNIEVSGTDSNYGASLCYWIGQAGIEVSNCANTVEACDLFMRTNALSDKVIFNDLYNIKGHVVHLTSMTRISGLEDIIIERDAVESGELTYKLMNPQHSTSSGLIPNLGQNIDRLKSEKDNRAYIRQYNPQLLGDDTQFVYEKCISSEDYSTYSSVKGTIYTNYEINKNLFNVDNSYKININLTRDNEPYVLNDENQKIGSVNGYTTINHDNVGNATADFNIYGENGYMLNSIKFGSVDVSLNKGNDYSFRILKIDNKYYFNGLELKYEIIDGYVTFQLDLNFDTLVKPEILNGYYSISNVYELKWFSNYINHPEMRSQNQDQTSQLFNARIKNDIIIPADIQIEPIGTKENPFCGEIIGCWWSGNNSNIIYNSSSQPLFGVLGTNAKILNLTIDNQVDEASSANWTSALASSVCGTNVLIDQVVVSGNVKKPHFENDVAIGSLISEVLPTNQNMPSSVLITNCVNKMNIDGTASSIGGLIGRLKGSLVSIENCVNAADVYNTESGQGSAGGAIGNVIQDDIYINSLYTMDMEGKLTGPDKPLVNINNFQNIGNIKALVRKSSSIKVMCYSASNYDGNKDYGCGAGGVIGSILNNSDVANKYGKNPSPDTNLLGLTQCSNQSNITSNSFAGGLVGYTEYREQKMISNGAWANNSGITVKDCSVINTVINVIANPNGDGIDVVDRGKVHAGYGGIFGALQGKINVDFINCNSIPTFEAKEIAKFGWGDIVYDNVNIGGFIGCLYCPTRNNQDFSTINVKHSYTYMTLNTSYNNVKDLNKDMSSIIRYGGFAGTLDDIEDKSKDFDSFYYGLNVCGNEDLQQNWDSTRSHVLEYATLNDFRSGKVAYMLSKNVEENNKDKIFGQVIDLEGKQWEVFPSLGGPKVYMPYVGYEAYSNYNQNNSNDDIIIDTHAIFDSTYIGLDQRLVYKNTDTRLIAPIGTKLDNKKLSVIRINGVEFTDNSPITIDNLIHDIHQGLDSPIEGYGDINLYILNDCYHYEKQRLEQKITEIRSKNQGQENSEEFKKINDYYDKISKVLNLYHSGINIVEYSYIDSVVPNITKYQFHESTGVEDAYVIKTGAQLDWFFNKSEGTRQTNNIVLKNDIDMSNYPWNRLPDNKTRDYTAGRFFGEGHKIYNLSGNCEAFINNANNAEFRDFELNVDFNSDENIASAFIKYSYQLLLLDNITVSGSIKTGASCNNFGGILCESGFWGTNGNEDQIGRWGFSADKDWWGNNNILKNVVDDEKYKECNGWASNRGNRIYNCKNNLSSISFGSFVDWAYHGGIVGKLYENSDLSIYACTNNAEIQSSDHFGSPDAAAGIIAYVHPDDPIISIYNCTNNGHIKGYYAGGIIGVHASDNDINSGYRWSDTNVKSCSNLGEINGRICGGIMSAVVKSCDGDEGDNEWTFFNFDSCINKGKVKCTYNDIRNPGCQGTNRAGGIIALINDGWALEHSNTYITKCINVASVDVDGDQPAGGILGFQDSANQLHIFDCYSIDEIYGTDYDYIGCITGVLDDDVDQCNNFGIGHRDIGLWGDADKKATKSIRDVSKVSQKLDYIDMMSGRLCYLLNDNSYHSTWSGQHTGTNSSDLKFLNQPANYGQKLDDFNNKNICSQLYPEPNKQKTNPVYLLGSISDHDEFMQNNANSFLIYDTYYSKSNNKLNDSAYLSHDNIYSNFKPTRDLNNLNVSNTAGISVHVRNTTYEQEWDETEQQFVPKFVDNSNYSFGNQILGSVQVQRPDGTILSPTGLNKGMQESMANNYQAFYYTNIGNTSTDNNRSFTFVFQPAQGCSVSWVAIDGVLLDKNQFDPVTKQNANGNIYNVFSTEDIQNYNGFSNFHTIDVGFSSTSKPRIVDGVYQITNYPELMWFSQYVNDGNVNAKAKILNDIVASTSINGGWLPIGTDKHRFRGSIDGNNKIIRGLTKTAKDDHIGFVAYGSGCSIQNLRLEYIQFQGGSEEGKGKNDVDICGGGLIGYADNVTVKNIYISGYLKTPGWASGGIIGYIRPFGKNNYIQNCVSEVQIQPATVTTGHVGGIVGYIDYDCKTLIDQCANFSKGTIRSNQYTFGASDWRTDYAGGIVGYGEAHDKSILVITNCINKGAVFGDSAGGIIADYADDKSGTSNPGAKLTIAGCNNFGPICGDYCGGIMGRIDDASINQDWYKIEWCNNFGNIGDPSFDLRIAGGIIGELYDGDIKLDMNYCNNYALVYAGGGYVSNHAMNAYTIASTVQEGASLLSNTGVSIYNIAKSFKSQVLTQSANLFALVWNSIVWVINQIFNWGVLARATVPCRAAGIIGYVRLSGIEKVNMSNIFNYGMASAATDSNGITSRWSTDMFCSNVYTINSYGKSDNSKKNTRGNTRYVDFNEFSSGKAAWDIQQTGRAGMRYDGDDQVYASKDNPNKIDMIIGDPEFPEQMIKKSFYFGQNLDNYISNKPIAHIPNYANEINNFVVYKFPTDFRDKEGKPIISNYTYYTNNKDSIKDATQNFGLLNLYGSVDNENESTNINQSSNDNNFDNNVDNKQNDAGVSFASENESNDNGLVENDNKEDNNLNANDNSNNESSKTYEDNKLINHFDISVRGSKSFTEIPVNESGETKDNNTETIFNNAYNMFPGEDITITIKPKKFKNTLYSIKDVFVGDLVNTQQGSTTIYKQLKDGVWEILKTAPTGDYIKEEQGIKAIDMADGRHIETLNARYMYSQQSSEDTYLGCDAAVIYNTDGSVEINIPNGVMSHAKLDVHVRAHNKSVHVHEIPGTNQKIIYFPWTSKDSLPNNTMRSYYLDNDVTLDSNWVVPEGNNYLCLDGHKINLKKESIIDVSGKNTKLFIADCRYNSVECRQRIIINDDYTYYFDKAENKEEEFLTGGMIYSTEAGNNNGTNSLIKLGCNNTLYIDKVNLLQRQNDTSVIDVTNSSGNANCLYNLTINAPVYEQLTDMKKITKDFSVVKLNDCCVDKSVIEKGNKATLGSLTYGVSYKHMTINNTENHVADILNNTSNTNNSDFYINVKFADKYNFDKNNPITVLNKSIRDRKNTSLTLTTDFDKYIKNGIAYGNVFKSWADDMDIVLCGENDNNCNNVCLLGNLEGKQTIKMNIEGYGYVYPRAISNDDGQKYIAYKDGSKAKLYYQASDLSYLENIQVQKTLQSFRSTNGTEPQQQVKNGDVVTTQSYSNKTVNCNGIFDMGAIAPYYENASVEYMDNNKVKTYEIKEAWFKDIQINAKFVSTLEAAVSVADGDWIEWNGIDEDSLLQEKPHSLMPGLDSITSLNKQYAFRLVNDINLFDTWNVPFGRIVIDLNGHNITWDSRSNRKTGNLINIDDADTILSIMDSSLGKENTPVTRLIKQENDTYKQVSSTDQSIKDAVSVKGGLIWGANVSANRYDKYVQRSGAILVNKGVLNFISGTVGFNTSDGILGGAGISVEQAGRMFMYKDAHVIHNSITGDINYQSKYFSAGVSCQGYFKNEGEIAYNVAKTFSSSAVNVMRADEAESSSAEFINSGDIHDNICYQKSSENSKDNLDSFGAVFTSNGIKFTNMGQIYNNKANFDVAAVVTSSPMLIEGNSKIFGNKWAEDINSTNEEDWKSMDIDNQSGFPIEITGQLNIGQGHASTLRNKYTGIDVTAGWQKAQGNQNIVFINQVFAPEKTDDNKYVYGLAADGEVKLATINSVCKLDVTYVYGSTMVKKSNEISCNINLNENYICGDSYDIVVNLGKEFQILNININGDKIDFRPNQRVFSYQFKTFDDSELTEQKVKVVPIYISYERVNQSKLDYVPPKATGTIQKWSSTTFLPFDEGCYKLSNNIVLTEPWKPEKSIYLDLNGYSITTEQENMNLIYLDSDKADVVITDSTLYNDDYSHKNYIASNGDKGYNIVTDDKQLDNYQEVYGGIIGGAVFSNHKESGAIFVEQGKLNIAAGNIVANKVINDNSFYTNNLYDKKGASAIYVGKSAKVVLGDRVNVSYNYSQCGTVQRYDSGAAGMEVRGDCTSYATISNNKCNYNSVAGVAVISDTKCRFINKGDIINNVAKNNSVAAMLLCTENLNDLESNDVVAMNYGDIRYNTAADASIAGVELYGKMTNSGKITQNIVTTQDSFAGICAYGSLELDYNSEINRNLYKYGKNDIDVVCQDIVFSEDDYTPYIVNSNSTNALFTLGPNFMPNTKATYTNYEGDTPKPLSLTHVDVKNYDADKYNSKPLLLTKGFLIDGANRYAQDITSYFQVEDSNYSVSCSPDGDVYYSDSNQNASIFVSVSGERGNSKVNIENTINIPMNVPIPIPLEIVADETHEIESVMVSDDTHVAQPLPIKDSERKRFSTNLANDSKSKHVDIKFKKSYSVVKVDDYDMNKDKLIDPIRTKDLPVVMQLPNMANQTVKLGSDIVLETPWVVPVGNTVIDLNGYNIYASKKFHADEAGNNSLIVISGAKSSLYIINSKAKLTVKDDPSIVQKQFIADKDTGLYKVVEDNQTKPEATYASGGCIFGGGANIIGKNNPKDDKWNGGALHIGDGAYVSLANVNLIGNYGYKGGAAYNAGEFYVSLDSIIEGNTAHCGAAVYNEKGSRFRFDGTIKNNIATEFAGGIYSDSLLQIDTRMVLQNNYVRQNGVSLATAKTTDIKVSDVDLPEFTEDDLAINDKDKKGSVISILQPVFGIPGSVAYVRCLDNNSSKDVNVLKLIEIRGNGDINNVNTLQSGQYVLKREGFYKLEIKDTVKNIYKRQETLTWDGSWEAQVH